MNTNPTFLVNKTNLFDSKVFHLEKPELKDQEVLFEIERFSFTSNNVTYAVVGDKIGYWNFLGQLNLMELFLAGDMQR